MTTKPEYEWIGRKPCNCCVALMGDDDSEKMYLELAEWKREGLNVTRISRDELKQVFNEDGFMNCPHGQLKLQLIEE